MLESWRILCFGAKKWAQVISNNVLEAVVHDLMYTLLYICVYIYIYTHKEQPTAVKYVIIVEKLKNSLYGKETNLLISLKTQ